MAEYLEDSGAKIYTEIGYTFKCMHIVIIFFFAVDLQKNSTLFIYFKRGKRCIVRRIYFHNFVVYLKFHYNFYDGPK